MTSVSRTFLISSIWSWPQSQSILLKLLTVSTCLPGLLMELELLLNSSPIAATFCWREKVFSAREKFELLIAYHRKLALLPLPQQLMLRRVQPAQIVERHPRSVLVDDGEHCVPARAGTQFAQTKCVGHHQDQNYPFFTAPFHVRWINLGLFVRDRSVVVD